MKRKKEPIRERIYTFLEQPQGLWPNVFQGFIFLLIFISVGMVGVEFLYSSIFLQYESIFHVVNLVILLIFTIEFLLRLFTAPKKMSFVTKPLSLVDFFAIAPNYLEFVVPAIFPTTELRILRLIRLLRFSRALRLLMLFRYQSIFKKVLQYQGTILQAITPVLVFLGALKLCIVFLEMHHLWISDTNLEQLFAIIGFALGIILSVKIEMTHDKFLQVENATIRLYATLRTLTNIINRLHPGYGKQTIKEWTQTFLKLLHSPKADNFLITKANEKLYKEIATIEEKPADIHNYYLQIVNDAAFCLEKKTHLTPKAYDTLLHQATMLYLILTAIFIPGLTGFISVLVASYVLYGMYYLTQDMDTIIAGEFDLINIRTSQLEHLVEN